MYSYDLSDFHPLADLCPEIDAVSFVEELIVDYTDDVRRELRRRVRRGLADVLICHEVPLVALRFRAGFYWLLGDTGPFKMNATAKFCFRDDGEFVGVIAGTA